VATSGLSREELQKRFDAATGPDTTPPPPKPAPNDVLGYSPMVEDLDAGKLGLIWTTAEAYADSPDRVIGKTASYGGVPLLDVDSVRYNVVEQMRRARSEVTIVSPYLIPGATGLEVMREIRGRNVKISVVTNSLAAHRRAAGPHRLPALPAGHAPAGRRSLRTELDAHAAQRAAGAVRHLGRAAACQVGGDRPAHPVRRLDEFRPALRVAQHRDRAVSSAAPKWRSRRSS
jgi:phosphatidylserine/phosphatidylglycerophosphate/cardiolipin synthase-like enzyme